MRLTVIRRFMPSFLRMLIGLGLREVELWIVCFLIRLVYRIWNLESTTRIRHLLELLFVKRCRSFLFFRYLLDFGQLVLRSIFLAALTRAASTSLRSSFRLIWTALTWLTYLLFFIWVKVCLIFALTLRTHHWFCTFFWLLFWSWWGRFWERIFNLFCGFAWICLFCVLLSTAVRRLRLRLLSTIHFREIASLPCIWLLRIV